MQTAFSIAMLILAAFILLANPNERLNRWCSLAIFFFCLGVVKQAVMFEIIPVIKDTFGAYGFEELFGLLHNLFTWVIYALAMPTMAIAGFYFGYVDIDKRSKYVKYIMYLPGALLLLFFSPLRFIEYQNTSLPFWTTYTLYNLAFGIIIAIVAYRGIRIDKKELDSGSILKKKRNRRLQEAILLLPPLYIWFFLVFPAHLIARLGINGAAAFFDAWQFNLATVVLSIFLAVYFAIKGEGFFGVMIVPIRYSYKHKMLNSEFVNNFIHRVKSETAYMVVKIDKIKEAAVNGRSIENNDIDELLDIIKRLNNISRRYNRYSNDIELNMKFWNLCGLIKQAMRTDVRINITINERICLKCDAALMIEAFKDIIDNSVQAIHANYEQKEGEISIIGTIDANKCIIRVKDNGIGIKSNKLKDIFNPGVSTKNKEYNSGMGLANCEKTVTEHGGYIYATSEGIGKGATVIIAFPLRIVDLKGKHIVDISDGYKNLMEETL